MYFHSCSQHGKPLNRLCGLRQCCLLLCEHCLPQHFAQTGHPTALLLASQTLNFFESFTGYTHYKMFDWLDCIRRQGFGSLFSAEEAEADWLADQEKELTALGLQVIEDFQRLAQNNRQFVLNNRNSQSLYHPEFLHDIFNLATEQWAVSAQLILNNLAKLAALQYPQRQLPRFAIRQQFLESIEAYRTQLLSKIQRQVVLCSATPFCTENAGLEDQGSEPLQAEEYELPYSIKQIQSFEEIGERANRARNTMCSIANDHQHEPSPIKQPQPDELGRLRREMEAMRAENSQLLEENRMLRAQNHELSKQKEGLLAKIQAFAQQNKENELRVREFNSRSAFEALRKVRVVK